MGWQDSLAGFGQTSTGRGVSSLGGFPSGGYSPSGGGSYSSPSNWLGSFTASKPKGYVPPAFPESLPGFGLPWSSMADKPFVPRGDTTGNFVDSLSASFDNAIWQNGYVNVANLIPWAEERFFVAAKELALKVEGTGSPTAEHIDWFAGLVKNIAEPVQKIMDWFPNTVRDTYLNQRTSAYKALVTGESIGPLEAAFSQLLGQFGLNEMQLTGQASIAGQLDPKARLLLAAAIDLPESVKREIEKNPTGDAAKYLDAAPEGRMFSYDPGIGGTASNLVSMGVLYGIELLATGGVAGVVRAASGGTAVGANALGYLSGASRASNLYGFAAKSVSAMAKAQRVLLATGLSMFGATTLTDAVLRTMGNKEGVAYLDHLNRTYLISDSPAVQLVSAFTVNPIAAAKAAVRGEIKFLGTPLIVVDKALGARFLKVYNHEDVVLRIIGKMYGISPAAAKELVGPGRVYETKGHTFNQIMSLAADSFVQKLSNAERNAINALPTPVRTHVLFTRYAKQILDEVDSPQGLIARFRRDTAHHKFYGEFDPEIAKIVTKDFAEASFKNAKAREEFDAVAAYVELLNPEGQRIVKETIEGVFAGGRQGTLRDLNALSAKKPALNGIVDDLVAKGTNGKPFVRPGDIVPREVFDAALLRATDAYDAALPSVRAAAEVAPILRPKAGPSEWAQALDTTQDTIEALGKGTGRTPAQDGLISAFLRERGLATDVEIAAAKADDLYAKALRYFDETTEPWVKNGERVAAAEAQLGEALERAARAPVGSAEAAAANKEAGELQALLSHVRDPQQPYAATVKFGERAETQVVKDARRKVDALDRLETIRTVREAVKPADDLVVGDLLHSVEQANGVWAWVAEARVTSGRLFDTMMAEFNAFRWPHGRVIPGRANRVSRSAGMTEEARQFHQSPPEYQVGVMAQSEGFLRRLEKEPPDKVAVTPEIYGAAAGEPITYGELAAAVRANARYASAVTEITQPMWEALGVANREAFIAKLGNLRSAYDDALGGKTEAWLDRTSKIKVDEWTVEYARTNGKPASIYHDPSVDVGYGNALNDLRTALDTAPAAAKGIVEANPRLLAEARELAVAKGQTAGDFLANPANAADLRSLLPAKMPDYYRPGLPKALTPLDEAIAAGDTVALADAKIDLANLRGTLSPPVKNVPIGSVDRLAAAPRLSRTLADDLNAAGIHWQTLIPEELWAKSVAGSNALAVILTGSFDRRPKTIMGLLDALKQIENGNAANMGVGAQMSAEAQTIAQRVVAGMIGDARRAGLEIGVVGMGKMQNPYTMAEDQFRMLKELFAQEKAADNLYVFRDEMGLQYGLKARPRGKVNPATGEIEGAAVAVNMESIPGLAEELLVGRFQPWQQRIGAVRAQETFGRLFHLPNQQITFEARGRFETQMAKYGVPASAAERVWSAWRKTAKESRGEKDKVIKETGERYAEPASSARYATEKNIENWMLNRVARDEIKAFYESKGGVPANVKAIDWSQEMRLAGSYTRRILAGGDFREAVEKLPMGDWLQRTYGMFAHNEWVTTKYFLFRFALDARFHAQNKVEGSMLYYGRAGLKVGEIDEGMFGMNRAAIKTVGEMDTMSNTGYPFAVTRDEWINRLFKKEQPDALRGLVAADPALMRRAMKEIAELDPELSATIAHMGHTPDQYLKVMDAYYGKLMKSADPEALVRAELDRALLDAPELAEVYSRIYDVNAQLLGDIRALMYGNPNRGQIERTLNSFLLYWPISYQLKATKWLLNIMYGKIGGVQTGGLGAVALDRMQADHERKLVEDPEYAAFFEENQTLVFASQMILPMQPGGMSVGLAPLLRDIFFPETAKGVLSIGPIYTVTRFIPGIAGDLYPYVKDVPFVDTAYKAATGWLPPKPKKAAAGFTPFQ